MTATKWLRKRMKGLQEWKLLTLLSSLRFLMSDNSWGLKQEDFSQYSHLFCHPAALWGCAWTVWISGVPNELYCESLAQTRAQFQGPALMQLLCIAGCTVTTNGAHTHSYYTWEQLHTHIKTQWGIEAKKGRCSTHFPLLSSLASAQLHDSQLKMILIYLI